MVPATPECVLRVAISIISLRVLCGTRERSVIYEIQYIVISSHYRVLSRNTSITPKRERHLRHSYSTIINISLSPPIERDTHTSLYSDLARSWIYYGSQNGEYSSYNICELGSVRYSDTVSSQYIRCLI